MKDLCTPNWLNETTQKLLNNQKSFNLFLSIASNVFQIPVWEWRFDIRWDIINSLERMSLSNDIKLQLAILFKICYSLAYGISSLKTCYSKYRRSETCYFGQKIDIRDRIEEGGQWGYGHLRIGIFEKLVTLEISKRSLYKPIFSSFLGFLCIFMQ